MNRAARIGWNLVGMALGSGLVFVLVWLTGFWLTGGQATRPPTPSPSPSATPTTSIEVAPLDDCRPCDKDARLTCCYPLNTVELDEASKRVLNFAFNLEGVVGEHDRLFQVTAERLRACDRRYADADARIAKLEDDLRDLGLKVREIERARKRRR